MTIHIDIVDQSSYGRQYDYEKWAHAIQGQIRYQVAGPWGIGNAATVRVVDRPAAGHWPVFMLDDSDVDGALGYHTTDDNNPILPIGKVFVGTDRKYGLEPSVTLSHECVEIIGDPMGQYTFQATATQFWVVELCDAVEADRLGYEFEGVLLSDFVLPQWFYGGPGPYSFRRSVGRSRMLAPGGYQAYFDVVSRTWKQTTAQTAPGAVSRAYTMGRHGRVMERSLLQQWAEAVPQTEIRTT
jgi:hypothetical protein